MAENGGEGSRGRVVWGRDFLTGKWIGRTWLSWSTSWRTPLLPPLPACHRSIYLPRQHSQSTDENGPNLRYSVCHCYTLFNYFCFPCCVVSHTCWSSSLCSVLSVLGFYGVWLREASVLAILGPWNSLGNSIGCCHWVFSFCINVSKCVLFIVRR